jgi:hypothetical protein
MIDISVLEQLQKNSSHSFHQHKKLIKKLTAGQQVLCETCKQPLKLRLPVKRNDEQASSIFCDKGCTDILLDCQ